MPLHRQVNQGSRCTPHEVWGVRCIETPRSRAPEPLFCLLPQQWRAPGLLKTGPTGIALGFPSSHYGAAGTQEAPGRALDWDWGTGAGLGSALGHLWPPVPQLLQRRWASDVRGTEDGGPPMLDDRSGDRRPSGGPANLRPQASLLRFPRPPAWTSTGIQCLVTIQRHSLSDTVCHTQDS